MLGDSTLARPTTPTSDTSSSPKLAQARASGGRRGMRPSFGPPRRAGSSRGGAPSGRRRRWPTAHERGDGDEDELRAASRCGPGELVVKLGSTSVSVASATRAARPALAPSIAEPLLAVAQAAEQQAHADDAVADDHHGGEDRVARQAWPCRPPASITDTISATSITVTASASTSVRKVRQPDGPRPRRGEPRQSTAAHSAGTHSARSASARRPRPTRPQAWPRR